MGEVNSCGGRAGIHGALDGCTGIHGVIDGRRGVHGAMDGCAGVHGDGWTCRCTWGMYGRAGDKKGSTGGPSSR